MKFLKKIEAWNKRFIYFFLKMLFRNKEANYPLDNSNIKKVLILRYDAIGDMIVTTPVFGIIEKYLPGAEIHVLASHRNFMIPELDERISGVHVYDLSFRSFLKNVIKLRKEKFDVILSLVLARTTVAGMLANLIGGSRAVKVTLRHDTRYSLYSTLFNIQIPAHDLRGKYTMAEIQARLACETFGWNYDSSLVELKVPLPDIYSSKAGEFLEENHIDRFIILNISSGNSFRRWSVEKNAALLHRIAQVYPDLVFVIISAPSDYEEALAISRKAGRNVFVFDSSPDIFYICGLIGCADLVITPDTSIVHFAASYGVPVLVMYSRLASFILEWMPFGVPYRSIVTKNREPLESLSVDEALSAFESLYEELQTNRTPESL